MYVKKMSSMTKIFHNFSLYKVRNISEKSFGSLYNEIAHLKN